MLLIASSVHYVVGADGRTLMNYGETFVYVMGSLFLLDVGYVIIARARPMLGSLLDKVVFLGAMSLVSVLILVPYFAEIPSVMRLNLQWLFAIVLLILSMRVVVGLLVGKYRSK